MNSVSVGLVACCVAVVGAVGVNAATVPGYVVGPNGHEYCLVSAEPSQTGPSAAPQDNGTSTLRTWEQARANALLMGSGWDLATINDDGENEWLLDTFRNDIYVAAFIGLYQESGAVETDQGWKWASGQTDLYRNWNAGEPNDEGGAEHYGAMYFTPVEGGSQTWAGFWNDIGSKYKSDDMYRWGIAERSPISTPDGGMTLGLLGLGLAGLGLLRRKLP